MRIVRALKERFQTKKSMQNTFSVAVMKVIKSSILCLCLTACHHKEIVNLYDSGQAQSVFEEVWHDYDRNYVGFYKGGPDWDSLHTLYKSKITPTISPSELFQLIGAMLLTLQDAHADVYDPQTDKAISFYNQFIRRKPTNFLGDALIQTRYLTESNSVSAKMIAGRIGTNIGYLKITDFVGTANTFLVIDSIIHQYGNLKGFIIDVRGNGGGFLQNAYNVASRFTNQHLIYGYYKNRNGVGKSDFTDFMTLGVAPLGPRQFLKPVIILTNRRSFSAAEEFVLMLHSRPQTRQVGDTTFGGVYTYPISSQLSTGWKYRVPSGVLYDAQKHPIKGGIAPDITIQISQADSLAGKDTILEKAIRLLQL